MPDEIAEYYRILDKDVTIIHARWNTYLQLFESGPKRIQLLEKIASTFFVDVYLLMRDDIVLSLSRLTDPATSFGHDNLSLQRLIETTEQHDISDLTEILNSRMETIQNRCAAFRKHRNKRVAHPDLQNRVDPNIHPLPKITKDTIEAAFECIRDFMNDIKLYFDDSSTMYDFVVTEHDGEALVQHLKEAVAAREFKLNSSIYVWKFFEENEFHDA